MVVEQTGHLISEARRHIYAHESFYLEHDVDIGVFELGVKRNDFESRYCDMYDFAMGATPGTAAGKKKGRKELFLRPRTFRSSSQVLKVQMLTSGELGRRKKRWTFSAWKKADPFVNAVRNSSSQHDGSGQTKPKECQGSHFLPSAD